MRKGSTSPELINLIRLLKQESKENRAPIWKAVAEKLSKSRRGRIAINISRINRYTETGDTVIIPGKVLGAGTINHPVTVAAFRFSRQAKEKIREAGGACITIEELVKKNPKGSSVRIIG